MPGIVIFKPINAELDKDKSLLGVLDPYCKITIGNQKVLTHVCKKGGSSPEWNEILKLRRDKSLCHLEVKNKGIIFSTTLGSCDINLDELEKEGRAGTTAKWYIISRKNKLVGQILIETTFEEDTFDSSKPDLVDLDLESELEN